MPRCLLSCNCCRPAAMCPLAAATISVESLHLDQSQPYLVSQLHILHALSCLPLPFAFFVSPYSPHSILSPFSFLPSPFSLLLSPFSFLPSPFSLLPSHLSLYPLSSFLFPSLHSHLSLHQMTRQQKVRNSFFNSIFMSTMSTNQFSIRNTRFHQQLM
jgi:hypothetical protein